MRPTKGRDEEHARIGAGRRLDVAEQEREIAVDPLLLEDLGGPDASQVPAILIKYLLAPDAALCVSGDDLAGPRHRRLRVEGEVRVHLRRDPARHDAGELCPERDREPVAGCGDQRLARAALPPCPVERLLDEVAIGGGLDSL
jgi:hypothetical protein